MSDELEDIYIRPAPKQSFKVELHREGAYDELVQLRAEREAQERQIAGLRSALAAVSEQNDRHAATLAAVKAALELRGPGTERNHAAARVRAAQVLAEPGPLVEGLLKTVRAAIDFTDTMCSSDQCTAGGGLFEAVDALRAASFGSEGH